MRKAQNFTIYPFKEGDKTVLIQSDKSIARIDVETGEGIFNTSPNGAFFVHLQMPSRKTFTLEGVYLQELRMKIFGEGKTMQIAGGIVTADNSGAVNILSL